uniref:Integrin-linked kinase-associated serine/threonine phosphatase n=1 Tax=Takifugu rubripes TaxID=31033 RepID=A0A3B5K5A2_TAKRU
MQDAHVLLPDMELVSTLLTFPVLYRCRVSYFAVFDGHGGARASQFAAENLHQILAKKFPVQNVDGLIRKCLLDTFRQTDEDFLKKASSQKPAWKDGSTVTCLLAVDDVVYVANLGDSRVGWVGPCAALVVDSSSNAHVFSCRLCSVGWSHREQEVVRSR